LTKEQLEAWFGMFEDLSVEQFQHGLAVTIKTYEFAGFPPVGLIRKNCGAVAGFGVMSATLRAQSAWVGVRKSIGSVGGYKSVQFDDPFTTATIRLLGGWIMLCDTPSGEKLDTWMQRQFLATYESLMQAGIEAHQAAPLMGIVESQRNWTGWGVDATGGALAPPLETIRLGLPELDKKMIRGVIQNTRAPVSLPAPAKEIGRMDPLPVPKRPVQSSDGPEEHERQKRCAAIELEMFQGKPSHLKAISGPDEKPFVSEAQ